LFYNKHALGICLVGNFNATTPSQKQMDSLKELILFLKSKFGIMNKNILLHKEAKATECPGANFPMEQLRNWLEEKTITE
jgi:N-acetylmuramoyl-L-alanine amidase